MSQGIIFSYFRLLSHRAATLIILSYLIIEFEVPVISRNTYDQEGITKIIVDNYFINYFVVFMYLKNLNII